MSTIRRQSIISSSIVYLGLALVAVTNLILAKEFRPDQYGLINGMFVAVGMIIYAFANMGTLAYVSKFYPYYKDNLPLKKNDMMTWAFLACLIGFLVLLLGGVIFKGAV